MTYKPLFLNFIAFYLTCASVYAADPIVDIILSADTGFAPLALTANAAASFSRSDATIIKYQWTTSHGDNREGQKQNFVFEQAGDYILSLQVIDSNGSRSQMVSKRIRVIASQTPQFATNLKPIARITLDKIKGEIPLSVSVNGLNSVDPDGVIKRYIWQTSDGKIAESASADFIFNLAGQYNINLLVVDDKGAISSANQLINVLDTNQNTVNNILPIALFDMSQDRGLAPFIVRLDARESSDPDGQIVDFFWLSSDGQQGTGSTPIASFNATGTYNITLRVTDNRGGQAYLSKIITVLNLGVDSAINQPPVADFSYSPVAGASPVLVTLDGSLSQDADGQIVNYRWLSSDTQQAIGVNAQLQFTQVGAYGITLRVTDNAGSSNSKTQIIKVLSPNVSPTNGNTPNTTNIPANTTNGNTSANTTNGNIAPNAAFILTQAVDDPFLVSVDASPSQDPDGTDLGLSFIWSSSYGATGTGRTAQFKLPNFGKYNFILTATDPAGATGISSQTAEVLRQLVIDTKLPPIADFVMIPDENGAIPFTVALDASNSSDPDGVIDEYLWLISDQRRLVGPSTALTFERIGNYNISLTVIDNDGLRSSLTKMFIAFNPIVAIEVPPLAPVAKFNISPLDLEDPVLTVISPISFSPLENSYQAGDSIVLAVNEAINSDRREAVDLWVAMETEDGRLLFLNNSLATPLSTFAQALKRDIAIADRNHRLFTYVVPPLVQGQFNFYAVYVQQGTNPMTDGFTVQRSPVLFTQLTIIR